MGDNINKIANKPSHWIGKLSRPCIMSVFQRKRPIYRPM